MSSSSRVDFLASCKLEREMYVRLVQNAEKMVAFDFPNPLGAANKEHLDLIRKAMSALDEAIALAEKG